MLGSPEGKLEDKWLFRVSQMFLCVQLSGSYHSELQRDFFPCCHHSSGETTGYRLVGMYFEALIALSNGQRAGRPWGGPANDQWNKELCVSIEIKATRDKTGIQWIPSMNPLVYSFRPSGDGKTVQAAMFIFLMSVLGSLFDFSQDKFAWSWAISNFEFQISCLKYLISPTNHIGFYLRMKHYEKGLNYTDGRGGKRP